MTFFRCTGLVVVLATLSLNVLAEPPSTVGVDRDLGPVRLSVRGEPGYDYQIQTATDPAAGDWNFLATITLLGDAQSWFDSSSAVAPKRFYRTVKSVPALPEEAPDFRLIDQTGKARRLRYYEGMPEIPAIVLIFTANGCAKFREMAPVIKSLTNEYGSQGVLFWLVDSNNGDNRSNILATATSLGMSNNPPILHDAAQIVARTYQATMALEAIAINTADWTIFYRGAIDDRLGSNAVATTQHYLADALGTFLTGGICSPKETRPAGCELALEPRVPDLSYSADIAPLLQNKCVRCHSPGNLAPWSMTNHATVKLYASAIRESVLKGEMPPWHADPFYSSFTNDFSLKPAEAAKLVQWIESGATRGTGPDPLAESSPPATNYPNAWPSSLGAPQAILRIPPQPIPATGTLDYRYINVTNNAFATDVWLSAAVVKPSNLSVVHHSLVFQSTDGGTGLDGFFAGYVPGTEAAAFPAGTAKLLRRGEVLRFQMHYTANGSAQTDQTELGLYVSPVPPTYPLQTKAALNVPFVFGSISIPPNAADFQMQGSYPPTFGGPTPLTTNILLYELSPHMHLRGAAFKYEAIYPTGARETLLSVPQYVFRWQTLFRFTQPKYIPRGSKIICTATWDNTSQNKELMSAYTSSGNAGYLPDRYVNFDEQSWDEMFIGYMNFAEVP